MVFSLSRQSRPATKTVTSGPESRIKEQKKQLSRLKNVDTRLANVIMDEILERFDLCDIVNFIFF